MSRLIPVLSNWHVLFLIGSFLFFYSRLLDFSIEVYCKVFAIQNCTIHYPLTCQFLLVFENLNSTLIITIFIPMKCFDNLKMKGIINELQKYTEHNSFLINFNVQSCWFIIKRNRLSLTRKCLILHISISTTCTATALLDRKNIRPKRNRNQKQWTHRNT